MVTRLLLVDENPKFRTTIKRIVEARMPGVVVYEHDPGRDGVPTRHFNWQTYQIVLLDYRWARDHGLTWLPELKSQPGFPGVLMFIGSRWGMDREARDLGADESLNKRKLTASALLNAIEFVLKYGRSRARQRELELRESAGPRIPGYKMISKLAEGGMSSIYLARRERDGERVVAKILYSESIEDETFVDRFLKEFEIISKIDAPQVVRIYEESYTEEYMYMIMEYLPGGDLHRRIAASGGLPLEEALRHLEQIAIGLDAIHRCGIVHRDLKPANIMFREDGSLAIIDFGISKELAAAEEITSENLVMGTVGYMSPEAGQGKDVDVRSDIYSLGIVFYEMLTGRKPYVGKDPADVVLKHVKAPIPLLPERFRRVQGLFEIMVAKDPDNRFPSARRLVEFLHRRYADLLKAPPAPA